MNHYLLTLILLLNGMLKVYTQQLAPNVTADAITLNLHEKTGYISNYAYYNEKDNTYIRTTGHQKLGGFIEEYDLSTGELIKLWNITETFGLGQFIKTSDGKYWVFNPSDRLLFLINNGKIEKTFDESNYQESSIFITYYGDYQFNEIILHDEHIYVVANLLAAIRFQGPLPKNKFGSFIRKININNGSVTAVNGILSSSKVYDYGFLNRYSVLKKDNRIIIAPFYSDEVAFYDLTTNEIGYLVAEDRKQIVKPISKLVGNPPYLRDRRAVSQHFQANAYYQGLLYDKYRRLYYRFKVKNINFQQTAVTVSILNDKFRKLGEYNLPSKYEIAGLFINKNGLNILNHERYEENRNQLIFDCFTF